MSDERYDLSLTNCYVKGWGDDICLEFKYKLTDHFATTKNEVNLKDIRDLLNTHNNTKDDLLEQLKQKNKKIKDLEAQLNEVDKIEFGNKLINLFHSLEGDESPEYIIMDYGKSQIVKEDIVPLLQDLIHCFNCMFESSEYQYNNNLLMLRYHVKGFKEVCKE